MNLTKEECVKAHTSFCKMHDNDDDWSPEDGSWGLEVFSELIDKYFSLQLTRSECDFIISCLEPMEKELGIDITLLINKLKGQREEMPKEKGVVENIEYIF